MTVGEVCTRSVVTATANELISEAARRMRDMHVGTVVVVENKGENRPVGILTDRDIVIGPVAQSPDRIGALVVGDVMSRDVATVLEDDAVHSALETMRSRGIRRVPVVGRDGRLEGLLAFDDVVEVMSSELSDLVSLVAREQKLERELHR